MNAHEIDPVALVFGLLFALSGVAVLTDRATEQVDVTALTGAGVAVVGVVLAVLLVVRLVQADRN